MKTLDELYQELERRNKIAEEAGVSPATIYLYFDNKEDMLTKLFIHTKDRMGHSYFSDNMDMSVSKATFRTIFLNHYQYIINNIEEYIFLEDFSTSAQISLVKPEFRVDYCPVFESLFNRSKESGLLQNMHNDIIYSLLFAPLSFLIKKTLNEKSHSLNTDDLMRIFESSWKAISK